MIKDFFGEQWKPVNFNFEFSNDFRLEISNLGRIRTFNKVSNGNIIKGSMVNGYRIIRLKLFRPRDAKTQAKLDFLKKQVTILSRKLKEQILNGENEKIDETKTLLFTIKKNLSKKFQDDLKERTINYHSLIHRLVAEYFLKNPTPEQTIVAHLDYDKLNNRKENLKWMTPEENYEHQKGSPHVIKEKQQRRSREKKVSSATKLTVTKVMFLKKLLNEGRPMKELVRKFKVTETQIYRIKKGENWSDIPAAK